MAVVAFRGVTKVFAGGARAVSDMDLEIGDGEFVVLVGPSGCGKTTALRMLAGLETITSGTVTIGDKVVNHVAPRDRDIAMVFQNYALYPHLKVYDNIAFGLRLRKIPKDEIDERVRTPLRCSASRTSSTASRAPSPAASANGSPWAAPSCASPRCSSWTSRSPTWTPSCACRCGRRSAPCSATSASRLIYVTHDQVEAMTMGDRVAVMRKGELQQVAPPQELYDRPVSLFVAGFIGSPTMNMFEAEVEKDGDRLFVQIGSRRLALAAEAVQAHPALRAYVGRRVVVGIRPEDMEDAELKPETPEDQRLRGKLVLREALGSEVNAHVEIDAPPVLTEDTKELAEDIGTGHHHEANEKRGSQTSKLVGRFDPHTRVQSGDVVDIAVDTRALHFFDIDSGLGIYDGPVSLDARRDDRTLVAAGRQEDHDVQPQTPHVSSA